MKKSIITTAIIASLFAAPNAKAEESKLKTKTGIGFTTGAIIGGVLGGPVGMVVTSFAGTLVGSSMEAEEKIQDLNALVDIKEQQMLALLTENQTLLAKLNDMQKPILQTVSVTETKANNQWDDGDSLAMTVQFRSGKSRIEPLYQMQVKGLAKAIRQLDHLRIDLAGFADRNGDETKNLNLSEDRVEAVRQLLIDEGIAAHRIDTSAFGESLPLAGKQSFESDFFDRRVQISLKQNPVQTASN